MQTHTDKITFRCWSARTYQKDDEAVIYLLVPSMVHAGLVPGPVKSDFITQLLNHISCFQFSERGREQVRSSLVNY